VAKIPEKGLEGFAVMRANAAIPATNSQWSGFAQAAHRLYNQEIT